ncbi:hypothetical protein [uncultured Endozoicomonas sp.]|uniref:hypothetical protein n=1 Tax=uncultured Endozoicomonas sp. TaxID=432652 RepID=UPI00261B4C96|nr:hypothetical protein [uncultured Endozoicomonas sp.]
MDRIRILLNTQFKQRGTSNPPEKTENNITPMMVDDASNTFDGQSIRNRHATEIPPELRLSQEISKVAKHLSALAGSAKTINPDIQAQLTSISTHLQTIAPQALQPFSDSLKRQSDVIEYLQLMKQVQSEITEHSNLAAYDKAFLVYQKNLTQTLNSSLDHQKRVARNPEYRPKLYAHDTTEGKFVSAKMETLSYYFYSNKLHNVDGYGIYGNCSVMAHKLYVSIKKSHPEKHIFLVHLNHDKAGDHQFVIVCNTPDIDDPENLVLDPWANIIFKLKDRATYLYNPTNANLILSTPSNKLISSFSGEDNFEPEKQCANKSLAYKISASNTDVGIISYGYSNSKKGIAEILSDMKLPDSEQYILISIDNSSSGFTDRGNVSDIVMTDHNKKELDNDNRLILAWPAKNKNHLFHFSKTYTENTLNDKYLRLDLVSKLLRQLIDCRPGYADEAVKACAQHCTQQILKKLDTVSTSKPVELIKNKDFIYLTNIILKLSSKKEVNNYFLDFNTPIKKLFEHYSNKVGLGFIVEESVSLHLCSTQWIQQAVDIIQSHLKIHSSYFERYDHTRIKNMKKPLKQCYQALSAYSCKLKIDIAGHLSTFNDLINELMNSPEADENVDAVLNKYRKLAAYLTQQDPDKNPSWTGFEL